MLVPSLAAERLDATEFAPVKWDRACLALRASVRNEGCDPWCVYVGTLPVRCGNEAGSLSCKYENSVARLNSMCAVSFPTKPL